MRLFINTLFWRIPAVDEGIDAFIEGLSKEELKFSLVDQDGNEAPKEVFDEKMQDSDLRKAYRASLGLINYRIIKNDEVGNWKFYFAMAQGFHATGDNPIIKRNELAKHPEDTEFIIPLASNNLLIHTKRERVEIIQPDIIVKIHLPVLLQSTKYACSINSEYLTFLNGLKRTITVNEVAEMKEKIFSAI